MKEINSFKRTKNLETIEVEKNESRPKWEPISKWKGLGARDKSYFKNSIMNNSESPVIDLLFLMCIRDDVSVASNYLDLDIDKYGGINYEKLRNLIFKSGYLKVYESDRVLFVRDNNDVYSIFRTAYDKDVTGAKLISRFENLDGCQIEALMDKKTLTLFDLKNIEPKYRNLRVLFRFPEIELSNSTSIDYCMFMGKVRDNGSKIFSEKILNDCIILREDDLFYKIKTGFTLKNSITFDFSEMTLVSDSEVKSLCQN